MKKKNRIKRNKSNIFVFFFFIVVAAILIKFDILDSGEFDKSLHLEILTINAIFAGFLFTSLGIMVGFSGNRRVADKDRNGYMDKYYNSIYIGLLFLIFSIILAVFAFVYPKINDFTPYLVIEQLTLVGGIIYFIRSCASIFKLIQSIRSDL